MQNLVNQLSNKVTYPDYKYSNTDWCPLGQLTNESKICLKCGRPVGSMDVTPQKKRTQGKLGTLEEAIKMTDQSKMDKSIALEELQIM